MIDAVEKDHESTKRTASPRFFSSLLVAEMVATDQEEAKKEAYLKLKGFKVVGSMENPPTNPDAVKAAGVKA